MGKKADKKREQWGQQDVAKVAKKAFQDNSTLKEAAATLNLLTPKEFDDKVRPEKMIGPR